MDPIFLEKLTEKDTIMNTFVLTFIEKISAHSNFKVYLKS